MLIHEGKLSGKDYKFAIIQSRFNNLVTDKLLGGALDCLQQHHADDNNIEIFKVPGAFELPLVARRLINLNRFHAIICLAAVIRGETPHFDFIAAELTKGLAQLNLEAKGIITYGVITADTLEQALERAGAKAGNKGWDAAQSALELINLLKDLT